MQSFIRAWQSLMWSRGVIFYMTFLCLGLVFFWASCHESRSGECPGPVLSVNQPLLAEFQNYVKNRAHCTGRDGRKEGVLLYFSSGVYFDMAHNCIATLMRHDCKCLLVFSDPEGVAKLSKANIPAFDFNRVGPLLPQDVRLECEPRTVRPVKLDQPPDWQSRWTSRKKEQNFYRTYNRWPHWLLRHSITLEILKMNISVMQCDTDVAFTANPLESSLIDPTADVQGQPQYWPDYFLKLPPVNCINLGIGLVRATQPGILHWSLVNSLMRYHGNDPQSLDNKLFAQLARESGIIEPTESGGYALNSPTLRAVWWSTSESKKLFFHAAGIHFKNKANTVKQKMEKRGLWILSN